MGGWLFHLGSFSGSDPNPPPAAALSWRRLIEARVYHFYDFIRQDRATVGFLCTGLLDGAVALLGSTCSSPPHRGIVPSRRYDHSQTDKTGPILGLNFFFSFLSLTHEEAWNNFFDYF